MEKTILTVTILFSLAVSVLFPQNNPQKISITKFENSVQFSQVFSEIHYVPLETNNLCYLTYPVQLDVLDSYIIIQDHKNDQVFLFSSDGKFISAIGKIGKGPGELIAYGDYLVDHQKKRIEVIDEGTAQSFSFDFSGNYIEKKKLIWGTSFAKTSTNGYLMYSGYAPHFHDEKGQLLDTPIALLDTDGKVINRFHSEFKPFALGVPAIMYRDAFTSYGDTIFFCPNRSNIIFQFVNNKLTQRTLFDFGKNTLPSKYSKITGRSIKPFLDLESQYVVDICQYYENDQFICLNFCCNGLHQVFIKKSNKKVFAAKSTNFVNDIDGIQLRYFHIMGSSKDYCYFYIQALDFKDQVLKVLKPLNSKEKEKYIINHPEVMKIYDSLSSDDNFVLVKLKYRS